MVDLTDQEIRVLILTRLAVDLWPVAGRALGLGRDAAYAAAKRGEIPTLPFKGKKRPVPTSFLQATLGLNNKEVA